MGVFYIAATGGRAGTVHRARDEAQHSWGNFRALARVAAAANLSIGSHDLTLPGSHARNMQGLTDFKTLAEVSNEEGNQLTRNFLREFFDQPVEALRFVGEQRVPCFFEDFHLSPRAIFFEVYRLRFELRCNNIE